MADCISSILLRKGTDIWSVTPDTTVYDAIALMADKGVGALLVVSAGRLVGVLSERDYARKIILQGRSSRDTSVEEVMSPSPITVTPSQTVDDCMRLMTEHRVRHLPVIDREKLVGVVSIGDLVNAIISAQAETIEHLHTYIGSNYPV